MRSKILLVYTEEKIFIIASRIFIFQLKTVRVRLNSYKIPQQLSFPPLPFVHKRQPC